TARAYSHKGRGGKHQQKPTALPALLVPPAANTFGEIRDATFRLEFALPVAGRLPARIPDLGHLPRYSEPTRRPPRISGRIHGEADGRRKTVYAAVDVENGPARDDASRGHRKDVRDFYAQLRRHCENSRGSSRNTEAARSVEVVEGESGAGNGRLRNRRARSESRRH